MDRVSYSPLSILLKFALVLSVCACAGLVYLVFFVWSMRSAVTIVCAVLFSLLLVFTVLAATTRYVLTTECLREVSVGLRNTAMPWNDIGAIFVYADRDYLFSSSALAAILFRALPVRRPVRITYLVKFTNGRGVEINIKFDRHSAPFVKQVMVRLGRPEKYFEPPGTFEGRSYDARAHWAYLMPTIPIVD